ncbi:MAG: RsmE family RNA methyltransferase [Candidatus Omnitrophica bacterium]|nr:RsmE family RNA methyltransferase [Candidatus Omnitrophota bacterium]
MRRFFAPSENISGKKITIADNKQQHYIKDVLRIKAGQEVIVFDEKTNEYLCSVEKLKPALALNIKKIYPACAIPRNMVLSLACAIPKKSSMDDIVDKLTQLGVDRVIPLETERTIVRLDKKKKELRLGHWRNVAQSASQQSQRSSLPVIEPVQSVKEALSGAKGYDLKLIPTLEGERRSLKDVLRGSGAKNILVFIGPEGDFSPAEVELAKKSGCVAVSLGKEVLRVETAAVAVASYIKFLYQG